MNPSTDSASFFSRSYAEARAGFLAAAAAAGLSVRSHPHPLPGRDGEALAIDVVLDGPSDAASLLIVSSACHGVEGFCGSAVQTMLLRHREWRGAAEAGGVAVLHIHALNPWGFSWWRRTTEENVDLNRNFCDFRAALPSNAAYDELAAAIVPPVWPPSDTTEALLHGYAARHGTTKLQAVISGGQYTHPDGLFYGGRQPTWSRQTLCRVLHEHATRCSRLGWIDVHTGLGPSGVSERIVACRDDDAALARARVWWGAGITSIHDGSSTSAPVTGSMWMAAYDECPQAEYTGLVLEYGTLPIMDMIGALRADQWLENHPGAPADMRQQIKQRMRDAFYIDTVEWKRRIIEQAIDAAEGAVKGLSADR